MNEFYVFNFIYVQLFHYFNYYYHLQTHLITQILFVLYLKGEGAPTIRKGTCANHIRDISKLLTGAHLTINARTDDDVETERIMEKISVVGSTYSFKENRNKNDDGRYYFVKKTLIILTIK